MINGVINIYKIKGFTSHDVVAKLRGIMRQKKIGHTGTLDPDATGVLPVCLGSATKLCDMLTEKEKEYIAKVQLGVTTDTQDMTGTVLSSSEVLVSEEEVKEKMLELIGKRRASQPLDLPSAGSAFKRPVGGYAAALIDQAGLKGYQVGGAAISTKHAGFAVNLGGATAADVKTLLKNVSDIVFENSGIRLEPEVRIW